MDDRELYGNYYWYEKPACHSCGKYDVVDMHHLGKLSHGWTFSFQAIAALGLVTWQAWKARLSSGGVVVGPYDQVVPVADFIKVVEKAATNPRKHAEVSGGGWLQDYLDTEGHSFSTTSFE